MKFKDLTDQKFGRLTVIERGENRYNKYSTWKCVCECGNERVCESRYLLNGRIFACECCSQKGKNETHGESKCELYNVWKCIKQRCYNSKHRDYKCYGGRGITVCDEWLHDFVAFREWALSNGYEDGLTIDRIDVNGNYEPSNCRWVTMKEQQNNRRNNHLITYNGKTQTVAQWAKEFDIPYGTLQKRLKLGWKINEKFFKKFTEKG